MDYLTDWLTDELANWLIFRHLNFKKCSDTVSFLNILTWKCPSRHSGVQFFDIWTLKSAPRPSVFLAFWLGNGLLATAACKFSASELQKVLRDPQFFNILILATAACNFLTSEQKKVVRTWRVLYIFTWKRASRHSGVQFFGIGTSKSAPNLTCFVHFHLKMCFSPQQPAILDFSSDHMTPHPPLERAYFSTHPTHESFEKHSILRLL